MPGCPDSPRENEDPQRLGRNAWGLNYSGQMSFAADMLQQGPLQGNGNGGITSPSAFDPFVTTPTPMTPGAVGPVSANPYSHDATAAMGGAFFANQTGFQQPVS